MTSATTMDGWPVNRSTLERLLPASRSEWSFRLKALWPPCQRLRPTISRKRAKDRKSGPSPLYRRTLDRVLYGLERHYPGCSRESVAEGNIVRRHRDRLRRLGKRHTPCSCRRYVATRPQWRPPVPLPRRLPLFGDSHIVGIHIPDGLRGRYRGEGDRPCFGCPLRLARPVHALPKQETVWAEIVGRPMFP